MSRSLVSLRHAAATDAPFLAEVWTHLLRGDDRESHLRDIESVLDRAAASGTERVVVADYDGQPAGAVLLRLSTLTPLNLDLAVQVMAPTVLAAYQRHGVGRALVEAGVCWAEEIGAAHVATAAAVGERDANRFLARLALGPKATLRSAPTAAVRAKLTAAHPVVRRPGARQLSQVLAVRRSMRRSESVSSG